MASAVRKIRLKRSIIVKGEHTEKGSVLECPAQLAHSLVGDGVAEYHEDSIDEVEAENQKGVTVHAPQHGDPEVRNLSEAQKKPKAKA